MVIDCTRELSRMLLPRDAIAETGGPFAPLARRPNDRDGASVDCRGVTPRSAGVALPERGLAQIAEIAQISKTSMDWVSVRQRTSPREFAQIAVIGLRSPRSADQHGRAGANAGKPQIQQNLDRMGIGAVP
jgi:hypothetical protein